MRLYEAKRTAEGNQVTEDGSPLPMAYDPDGKPSFPFDWGNSSQGGRTLALCLLTSALESEHLAFDLWDEYALTVVANLPNSGWSMTAGDVWSWSLAVLLARFAKIIGRGPSCIVV